RKIHLVMRLLFLFIKIDDWISLYCRSTLVYMLFFSRKLINPQVLNASGTLFGGSVLSWIDEEAAIFVICQLGKGNIVTKFMTEIDFISSARLGDIIEIGMETVSFGETSITVRCEVRNK